MKMTAVFIFALVVFAASATAASVGGGSALAAGPPGYGVMEPASDGCPWPDFLNPDLEQAGVEKCLPQQVAWTEGEGIRIVTDPLVGSSGSGWVNFWCETKEGFKYMIGVEDLAPHTKYTVTADSYMLGTIRTSASGTGQIAGVLRLPPGLYELDVSVWDGGTEVLSSPDDDMPGFIVFP